MILVPGLLQKVWNEASVDLETQLDHDELGYIADFGGGTSDFSLLRLGPSMRDDSMRDEAAERNRILSLAGVAIGGNDCMQ
jgi:hypothetical chaperone protein